MKAVIYMIICLSFCSELIHCSCLSYGHSCWGAHGKRSSNDRAELEPQQDRWALFKLIQEENDKYLGRDPIAKVVSDDSLEYTDKKMPNNLLIALRKRKFPVVILNSMDDANLSQDMQKPPFAVSNVRKRRSNKVDRNQAFGLHGVTSMEPNYPSTTLSSEYSILHA